MKTLLQIVQQFCKVTGLSVPTAVVSSTDSQVVQILALLNEGLDEIVPKYKWPCLQSEATFTSTAVESQGTLETIAPGFKSMIPDTFWNLTNSLPAFGSLSPSDTQFMKIWGSPSALVNFRQMNNELHFIPVIAAGVSFRFEYNSYYAVITATTLVKKQYFTADTDTCRLPDNLMSLYLRWAWKKEKGLPYAEEMKTFEGVCKQAYVDSVNSLPLRMGGRKTQAQPGVVVPLGSWNAP